MKKKSNGRGVLIAAVVLASVCLIALCAWVFAFDGKLPAQPTAAPVSPSSSSEAPSSSSVPEPEPVVTTLHMSATGDNLIHLGLYLEAAKRAGNNGYDFTGLYENVASFYQDYDVNWINQETLVTDEYEPSSYPMFCSPAALGQHMYDIGFRVFSLSNNHSYDKGAGGIAATRRFWASMPEDTVTTGFFAGESDYANIPLQEINGVTIAYLAYTEHTNGLPTPSGAEANVIYTSQEDVIQSQIELANTMADVVVVGVHWGTENSHIVNDAQRALGQKIADWGADIIIGTHPHVVQGIETLTSADSRNVPIAYSLGNFASLQDVRDNLVGIVLTYDITKTTQPDGSSEISVGNIKAHPVVMYYNASWANASLYFLQDYTDELAATHRVSGLTPAYAQSVVEEYIPAEYLALG